jgi:hypothetical protein
MANLYRVRLAIVDRVEDVDSEKSHYRNQHLLTLCMIADLGFARSPLAEFYPSTNRPNTEIVLS